MQQQLELVVPCVSQVARVQQVAALLLLQQAAVDRPRSVTCGCLVVQARTMQVVPSRLHRLMVPRLQVDRSPSAQERRQVLHQVL